MKNNLITLILISLLCLGGSSLQAQHSHHHSNDKQSNLTVSYERQAFWVFIDDIQQNDNPVRTLKIDRVPYGEHYLRIELDNNEHLTIGQYITVNQSNMAFHVDNQRHMYGFSMYSHGIPRPEQVVLFLGPQVNYEQGHGHHHGNHQNVYATLNDQDFRLALSLIKDEQFEHSKLSTAKQIASNHLLTVHQIAQICQVFEFDHTRLDFAKSAYEHCLDPNKYYLLHGVFTYDSYKTELDQYVQEYNTQQH